MRSVFARAVLATATLLAAATTPLMPNMLVMVHAEVEVAPDGSALGGGGSAAGQRRSKRVPRSNCVPRGLCAPCSAEDHKWAATDPTCLGTGFKQEHTCKIERKRPEACEHANSAAGDTNVGMSSEDPSSASSVASVSGSEACEPKTEEVNVYFACDPPLGATTDEVMYFEMFMVFGAAGSLYVVWQRKIQAYERMSSILSNR